MSWRLWKESLFWHDSHIMRYQVSSIKYKKFISLPFNSKALIKSLFFLFLNFEFHEFETLVFWLSWDSQLSSQPRVYPTQDLRCRYRNCWDWEPSSKSPAVEQGGPGMSQQATRQLKASTQRFSAWRKIHRRTQKIGKIQDSKLKFAR